MNLNVRKLIWNVQRAIVKTMAKFKTCIHHWFVSSMYMQVQVLQFGECMVMASKFDSDMTFELRISRAHSPLMLLLYYYVLAISVA